MLFYILEWMISCYIYQHVYEMFYKLEVCKSKGFDTFFFFILFRYFSLQATHPLGFDDPVRLEIESNICREGGPLPNCFTTPLRQAWTTMEKVRS